MLHCTKNSLRVMLRCTLILGALAVAGCFNVDQPPCTFACGDGQKCPDEYQCLADGYCHLHGQMNACGFTDAALAPDQLSSQPGDGGDLAVPIELDLAAPSPGPADLSTSDF